MIENYLLPFFAGFIILFIPLLLLALFIVYYGISRGLWYLIISKESFKAKLLPILFFLLCHSAIPYSLTLLPIVEQFMDEMEINFQQLFSFYWGFLVFILSTNQTFWKTVRGMLEHVEEDLD